MNKILTILFLLLCSVSFAQNKTIIPVGAVNNVNNNLGGVGGDSALFVPKSCGKPGDYTRYITKKNAGYIVLDTCNSVLYGWNSVINDFLPIGYPGQNSNCYGLIQPGYVSWSGAGLTYDVTSAIYKINCIIYTSAPGQITSPTADPTNPRYDVVAVDTLGHIVVVVGSASINPSIPQVDPASQVYLTAIYIPAGATTPQITQLIIYINENTENFAGTTSGITLDLNNTTNPYHLTKAANVGNSNATRNITFTQNSGVTDSRDYSLMKLYIWLKQNMPTTATIRISFLNGTTVVSNVVTIGGNLGFSKTIDSTYQNVTIPMGAFTFTNPIFNKVRITITGVQSGMYFDYVQLQQGILPPDTGNPYVTNYSSNSGNDSTILTTSAGQRFAASKGTALLSQGWGIKLINVVNPADSFYIPIGPNTLAIIDSLGLKKYFDQYYTNNTNPPDSAGFTFSVYSVDATPNFSYPTGTKVLVAASGTTGVFVGKENQVATLVGGVYSFTVPVSGDQLLVASTAQSFFFNGTVWIPQAIPDLVGGMNLGIPVPIGTKDNQSFIFKTHDTARIKIDSIGNTLLYQYAGLEDSNIYFKPGIGGKIDTGYYHKLIAGTGITLTAGLNRTDTISSTGGTNTDNWDSVLIRQGSNPLINDYDIFSDYHTLGFENLISFGANISSPFSPSSAFVYADTSGAGIGKSYSNLNQYFLFSDDSIQILSNFHGNNPQYSTVQTFTPDYIKIYKDFPSGNDGTVQNNVKVIVQSPDTLLTPPEFMYVSDNDTIKKYPFSGGGGSSLFPPSGTGTATGDVTGDLNGHDLIITGGNVAFANNGTPGTGKVPTGTDGAGNWTWETPSAGGVNFAYNENHTGSASTTLTLAHNYISGTIRLYKNGARLQMPTDFVEATANTITVTVTPLTSDNFTIDFNY